MDIVVSIKENIQNMARGMYWSDEMLFYFFDGFIN